MPAETRQRLDKWLWFARIVRTRTLAADLITAGHVRVNRNRVIKPGYDVEAGDVLTVAAHGRVRVLRVAACAPRRGSASLAQALYEDLAMNGGDGSAPQKRDASGHGNC
ncbi:MAG: RNA-binding S4 domain-containing protein [Alphaproteobacteria bacterium]|nr:RNA-binding S4 domain-containing protein [Alphaproteobacteria bacterium]